MVQQEILIPSTADNSLQPSLFFENTAPGKHPLLVGLHSWSYDRYNLTAEENIIGYAEHYGYHLLLPDFRGPNLEENPHAVQACGSRLAMQDICDAVAYILHRYPSADPDAVLLKGSSGGGHMALMMAGYAPSLFRAIAAIVPISNVDAFAEATPYYRRHVDACCCGDREEMLRRSPISYTDEIARANLKIFHGKYDPIVPCRQSMELYQRIYEKHPDARVFLDIFDGGHETDMTTVMHWLNGQLGEGGRYTVTG